MAKKAAVPAAKTAATTKLPDIVTAKATLLGTSAMLLNPATEAILEGIRTKTSPSKDRSISREEEARRKLLINADGNLYIPTQYLLSSLIEAGRHVDFKARTKISTKESTLLYSFMFDFPEDELVLTDGAGSPLTAQVRSSKDASDGSWWPDFRRGCNPSDGVLVALVRPRFDNWAIDVSFKVRTQKINIAKVREIFEISGCMVGLADFRPACRGPFGCYEVVKWELYGPNGELLSGETVPAAAETELIEQIEPAAVQAETLEPVAV